MENNERNCIICNTHKRLAGRLDCDHDACKVAVRRMPTQKLLLIRQAEALEALRAPGGGFLHLDYRDGTSETLYIERKKGGRR
jgi:hypothetical protein